MGNVPFPFSTRRTGEGPPRSSVCFVVGVDTGFNVDIRNADNNTSCGDGHASDFDIPNYAHRACRSNMPLPLSAHCSIINIAATLACFLKESVKILGVHIDSYLTWEHHVTSEITPCYCILIGLVGM